MSRMTESSKLISLVGLDVKIATMQVQVTIGETIPSTKQNNKQGYHRE